MERPEGIPGIVCAQGYERIFGGEGFGGGDESRGIGLLLDKISDPVSGYAAAFADLPAEERSEFPAASSTNSASTCETRFVA